MAWIKRNLYFVIFSIIALGLMGYGVFLLLASMSAEQKAASDIEAQYHELTRLMTGQGSQENIDEAKKQEAQVRQYIRKSRGFFQRVPPIPNFTTNKVSNSEIATALRNTIAQLRRSAQQQSVDLPPDYFFSFQAQQKLMIFNPASLDSLATHLGEVKALCDIMFAAKVNYLFSIQREIISDDDDVPADYITDKTVSTPLADLTPYVITFKTFSTELADVMAGLASSTNCFIVKSINVEPIARGEEPGAAAMTQPVQPVAPTYAPGYPNGYQPGGYAPGGGYGRPGYYPGRPGYPQPVMTPQPAVARGSQAFLTEGPFRVTLYVMVVKLKPEAKAGK